MKVYIETDLEGINGVDTIEMVNETLQGSPLARQYLMDETNAAIAGAFDAGAEAVYVLDGHYTGENFIPGALDPRAIQVWGKDMTAGTPITECGAFLLIGNHAMAGTEMGFLDHTQSSASWFDYQVNGVSHGELGQLALWGGAFGIPVAMISGDETACRQAEEMFPGIVTAATKRALCRNRAESLDHAAAMELVRKAAAEGVRKAATLQPLTTALPAEIQVTLYRNDYCEAMMEGHPDYQRQGRTLIKRIDKIVSYMDLMP